MNDEQRLEQSIVAAGRHMAAAREAGDEETARHWQDEQAFLIRQRSSTRTCYFSEEGEKARLAAEAGGAPHA